MLLFYFKIIFDRDLAELYGVETKNLNKAVTRNVDRFPEGCMFQLSDDEFKNLKLHFGTSSWGGTGKLPPVFICDQIAFKAIYYLKTTNDLGIVRNESAAFKR